MWWIGPLLVGTAAAGQVTWAWLPLVVAAFAGFCVRHPLALLVKVVWKGRKRDDLVPAVFWGAVYSLVATACGLWLFLEGHTWVVWIAAVGMPIFLWHLWLVRRGEDRHQLLLDLAAAAFLSLTAPAAYWACGGADNRLAWSLWLVMFLQTSGSIVHMFLRLQQRRLDASPPLSERLRTGAKPLAHHTLNLVITAGLAGAGLIPALVVAAMAITVVEGIYSVLNPPVNRNIKQLGMRQLWVSTAFVAVMLAAFLPAILGTR